jgi:hypothetical protein
MGFYSHLLNHKVTLKHVNGSDSNNNPVISDMEDIACRIEFKSGMIIGANGQQTSTTGRIFTEANIKSGDLIEFDGKDYSVVAVNPYYSIDASNVVNEVSFQ